MHSRIAALVFLSFMALPAAVWGQSVSLNIGSSSGLPGTSVSLPITISSSGGALPTAVQWSFSLPAGITLSSVDIGPAATAAGKSLSCGASNCLLFGLNATPIGNGTIATANLQIAANATGTLPISLVSVVASDINSIPASGGTGTITVNAPVPTPALNALTCGSGTIQTPGSLTCALSLTTAALTGGFNVGVSSNNGSLTVPSSVTIPAGQGSTTFTATAAQVGANTSATVTALAAGVTRTATISLLSPPALASLSCTPTSLNGGQSANCTAALDKAAVGSVSLALSDNNAALTTPASVTIANGSSSASFTVTAGSIASNQTATVNANYNGVNRSAQLNLVAPAASVLSSLSCSPTSFTSSGTATCTVSLALAAPANTSVSLSDGSANVSVPAAVTILAGQGSAQFAASVSSVSSNEAATITASLNGGTQSATLTLIAPAPAALSSINCSPASLNSNQSATCTAILDKASIGGSTITLSDNSAQLTTPGSLTIANGANSGTFSVSAGAIASSQTATITANLNGVVRTTQVGLVAPAGLSGLTCTPNSFTSAGTATCTVSLVLAAPANTSVSLSDGSANVSIPSSVTILAGQGSAQFTASVVSVTSSETATITASLNGGTQSASLSLVAPAAPAALSTLTCSPVSLASGQSASCTVNLDKPTAGGVTITLSDNNATLATPASVNIGNGASTGTFSVTAGTIAANQTATVTANLNGVVRNAQIGLTAPAAVSLSLFNCTSLTFNTAGSAACTVVLSAAAPANTPVLLSESSANVTVPGSVTVLSGQTTAQFTISVAAVTLNESATVTASLNGSARFVTLTLTAPPAAATLTSLNCLPASLTSSQVASCTASLDKASTEISTLIISDDSAQLTSPNSLTIGSGVSTGSFNVTAGSINSSQAVTVTATLNGVSRTTVVNLVAASGLSGLTCSPSTFTAAGTATCTVTLASAAPSNTVVSLAKGSASLTIPTSVTVLTGQNSAAFQVAVISPVADQTASITASANGGTQTVNLTLVAPAVLSTLTCAPPSLNSSQSATCTATLSKASPSTVSLTLSSGSPLLTLPGTVSILSGASNASFAVIAGTIPSSQTVSVTAGYNGVTKTAPLNLIAAPTDPPAPTGPTLSTLTCAPNAVIAGGSSLCVVTLASAPTTATSIGVSSGSDSIAVASLVTVQPGSDSAQFRVNIPVSAAVQEIQISASLSGVTRTAVIAITARAPVDSAAVISSVACSPSQLSPGATGVCTVYLNENTSTGVIATVSSNSAGLTLLPTVQILADTKSQSFDIVASESIASPQTVDIAANLNGKTVSTRVTLTLGDEVPPLKSFDCSSVSITSGGGAVCVVSLRSAAPFSAELSISSDNALILVPSRLTVASGATSVSFAIQVGNADSPQNVTLSAAWHGGTPITKTIQVKPHSITLDAPASSFVRVGSSLAFEVRATHSAGSSTEISASGLPSGANLRAGRFSWSPDESQIGEYPVQFRAQDPNGLSATTPSRVVVRAAQPTIQGLFNPAGYTPIESCSPNAIVTFLGTGFSLHDPTEAAATPWPTELAGVRIRINGVYAPITFVSDTTIHFQCPVSEPGVNLEIVMEYEAAAPEVAGGSAAVAVVSVAPIVVRMTEATPGVYLIKGTQGAVLVSGTGLLAGPPSAEVASRPVSAGEFIEIYANGLGGTSEALAPGKPAPLDHLITVMDRVSVVFGDGQRVSAVFAGLTPGSVGLFQVNAQVPVTSPTGSAVPLYLELAREDGTVLRSNTVTIAVAR